MGLDKRAQELDVQGDDNVVRRLAVEQARQQLFGASSTLKIARYRLEARLGAGGMGIVYRAVDEELGRRVALKQVLPGMLGRQAQELLRREARALARLSHPNVVQVYEVGEAEGQTFLTMEYVDGESLGAWLRRGDNQPIEILARFIAAGRGLAAAHRAGIVHRDFKPDNVLLGHDESVRVADFGLAYAGESQALDARPGPERSSSGLVTGAGYGTIRYMPLEQLQGQTADASSDQFSFCVALYEGLWGQLPFSLESLESLDEHVAQLEQDRPRPPPRSRVSRSVWAALRRGLAREPAQRWPDMDALLDALESKPRVAWPIVTSLGLGLGLLALGFALRPTPRVEVFRAAPAGGAPTTNAEELAAFAELYGYLRFFHPSDAAAAADWDALAVAGARDVVEARDQGELRDRLQRFTDPIAPTVRVFLEGEPAPELELDGDGPPVAWQHIGFGLGGVVHYQSQRTSRVGPESDATSFEFNVDPAPLRGQAIRVEMRARNETAERAQFELELRNRFNEGPLASQKVKIVGDVWTTYALEMTVREDATYMFIGGQVFGDASVWFDDISLSVIGGAEPREIPIDNSDFELGSTQGFAIDREPWEFKVVYEFAGEDKNAALRVRKANSQWLPGQLFEPMPRLGEVAELPLGAGLMVQLPFCLPDSVAAAPAALRPSTEPVDTNDARDPAVRAAALITTWSVLRHFYPYFDEIDEDWDAVLDEGLADLADDSSAEDLQRTLQRVVARLHDGFGHVEGPLPQAIAPVELARVEGRVVVTAAREGSGLMPGDIVTAIDGRAVEELVAEAGARVSGSPQWVDVVLLRKAALTAGPAGEAVTLSLRRGQERLSAGLIREPGPIDWPASGPALEELDDGVFHVDLARASWPEILARMDEIAVAPGVVFDIRSRPKAYRQLLGHLLAERANAKWLYLPHRSDPRARAFTNWGSAGWDVPPTGTPHIRGVVAFVIDARAIGYPESFLGLIEAFVPAEFVGEPTAGNNGDQNTFAVPGGLEVTFTGMKAKRVDGGQHHIVGIEPTIPVSQTLAGVSAGRDELLEAAIEVVRARLDHR